MSTRAPETPALFTRKATGLVREARGTDALFYNVMWASVALSFAFFWLLYGFAYQGSNAAIAFVIAVALGLPGAFMYAMLAQIMPRTGGDYVFNSRSLQGMWNGPPMEDLLLGLSQRRYDFRPGQLPSVVGMIAGSSIAAIGLVLNGLKTWQDAGSETAALVLRSLGIAAAEANQIATEKLPPLPGGAEPAAPRRRRRGAST